MIRSLIPVPTWSALRSLGRNKILKSSYFWIMVVPIAAKLFATMPDTAAIRILGREWTLSMGLPFSWRMFFFASLAFAGGSALFGWRCPPLVRDFESFSDFENKGEGSLSLLAKLMVLFRRKRIFLTNDKLSRSSRVAKAFIARFTNPLDAKKIVVYMESDASAELLFTYIPKANMSDAFTEARYLSDWTEYWVRFLCSLLYLAGFIFAGIVLLQNIMFVIVEVLSG